MRFVSLIAIMASLSACSEVIRDQNTTSRFATLNADGSFPSALTGTIRGADQNVDGDGYAYRIGSRNREGLFAEAGLLPGSDVLPAPTSGTAVYAGRFELAEITGINLSAESIYGFSQLHEGPIQLRADFDAATLRGRADDLVVTGSLDGEMLGGTVTWDGVQGLLAGRVGSDTALGVFHGDNGATIYAGGFVADR